jgi:23S rRNA pseudouridine2605 synthase
MDEMRLQKYLSLCGVSSRRKAEELMQSGRVTVNGIIADKPGIKVSSGDIVKLDGREVRPENKKIYILLNKPVGYITTVCDNFGRKTVIDLVKNEISMRIFPIGRLDADSEGLLLMTNDGDVAYALTHPKHRIDKTYIVTLNSAPTAEAVENLRRGVIIDKRKTNPAKIKWTGGNVLKISITEGRNRQIRRMVKAVGYEVISLKRIQIGMIRLGNVPLGRWRHLTSVELQYLKGLVKKI